MDLTDFDIVFVVDGNDGRSGGPVERRKTARLAVDEAGCWNEWKDGTPWASDMT